MAQAPIDVAEINRSVQGKLDVKDYELSFDEIRDETLQTEKQEWNKQTKLNAFCDMCFLLNKISVLCYLCKKYMCGECNKSHNKSHRKVELESKRGEREMRRREFLWEMRNESKRDQILDREDVSMVDRVNIKHALDKSEEYCITGLCGLNDTMWVVCDFSNYCIKMFSIGSHILERYLRFGSKPFGVTEIKVKRERTEQVVMTISDISAINQPKPDKQCLLAVTLPGKRRILLINLTHNPAVITKSITTDKECCSIDFSENKIFTLCIDDVNDDGYGPWFVTVMSTEGFTIKTISTHLHHVHNPCLAVCPGRIFITDRANDKALCLNDKGKVDTHQIKGPAGICVDPDTKQSYICSPFSHTIYRFDSSFKSLESLFDFESVNSWPDAVCLYRDRLYVGHYPFTNHRNFVTVVRVL